MAWTQFVKPILARVLDFLNARFGIDREHDVRIFKKLDSIADEPCVDNLLNDRIFTSNLRIEDCRRLDNLIEALERIENQYFDPKVRLRAEQLAWELKELSSHVFRTFFSVGDGWLKFRPDPIAPEVYEKEWEELNAKLEKAWEAYKDYRLTVKVRLKE